MCRDMKNIKDYNGCIYYSHHVFPFDKSSDIQPPSNIELKEKTDILWIHFISSNCGTDIKEITWD